MSKKSKSNPDKTKIEEASLVPLPENAALPVESTILPAEMQPSEPEYCKIDAEIFKMLTGTENEPLATDILIRGNVNHIGKNVYEKHAKVNLAINFMQEMQPQNALEAMLCSQMISLHCQGMDNLNKLRNDSDLNSAVKLLRLQHETIETLSRLRRNGEQKVIVQHVNVENGAQAVVGGVINSGR